MVIFLCKNCKGWILLSPIGIVVLLALGFVVVPVSWYEGATLADWIQSFSALLTAVVACFALNGWKRQLEHNQIKQCVLDLFLINEHFKSLGRIINGLKTYKYNGLDDYQYEGFSKGVCNAGYNFFKLNLDYKRAWMLAGMAGFTKLEDCHPDKIEKIHREIICLLGDILNGVDLRREFEPVEKYIEEEQNLYSTACKTVEKKLEILSDFYSQI